MASGSLARVKAPPTGRPEPTVVAAAQAVRKIPRGRRILIGSGAAEPRRLVDALISDGGHLADNDIVHMLTLGTAPYVQPGLERRFRHTALFIGDNVRAAVQDGRADFTPVFLSEIPTLIRSRRMRIDVALIQVSEPDRHGYVSLGVSVDIVRAAVDSAELVIAERGETSPQRGSRLGPERTRLRQGVAAKLIGLPQERFRQHVTLASINVRPDSDGRIRRLPRNI